MKKVKPIRTRLEGLRYVERALLRLNPKRLYQFTFVEDDGFCVVGATYVAAGLGPDGSIRLKDGYEKMRAEYERGRDMLPFPRPLFDVLSEAMSVNDGFRGTPHARYDRVLSWVQVAIANEQ